MSAWTGAARSAAALVCMAALAGCASVRNARIARDPARVPFGERTPRPSEVGLGSNTALTVDQAVALALSCHPAIIRAQQDYCIASQKVAMAWSRFLPSVDAGVNAKLATANTSVDTANNDSSESYGAAAGISQDVVDFGRRRAELRESRARLRAAGERYRAARNDISYLVKIAFVELGRAQELLRVVENAERQYAMRLEQARGFLAAGRRIRYDVTKAEVDLGYAQLDLVRGSNAVVTARSALVRSMGLIEDSGFSVSCPGPDDPAPALEGTLAQALRRHPELAALRADEEAASAALDRAVADLFPSLGLRFGYAWSGNSFPMVWNWSSLLQLEGVLYSGGYKRAVINTAIAQLRSARAAVADREQRLAAELGKALADGESAGQRLRVAAMLVRQTAESVELVRERYAVGAASAVEQTDATIADTGALKEKVNARYDCQAAAALVRKLAGEQ